VLRGRQVRIDLSAPDPHTTHELIGELDSLALNGAQVVVQRYGEPNVELESYLRGRSAQVTEIPLYRWALPSDTKPLLALLDAFDRMELDAVVFTSAAQVRNLFEFGRSQNRETAVRDGLARARVISIGPVCSRALEAEGVRIDGEASPPKFGPLMALLRERI
jgi:uroporphyrinogen-III synthase